MSENQNKSEKVQEGKKERSIRSETTKVFLVIFFILLFVGLFTVVSSYKGKQAFINMQAVHLKQFKNAEILKQNALDIIAIYYVLASDQDMNILMTQMQRYDGLIKVFDKSLEEFKASLEHGDETESKEISTLKKNIIDVKKDFDDLNNNARNMTFGAMEGNKEKSSKYFKIVEEGIGNFKKQIDEIESIVSKRLDGETQRAEGLLSNSFWVGISISILAVFITIGLIYYLMKFLSISLLPISNLMHNMRQAVFSIEESKNVISPVSNYSSEVFGEEIVGKSVLDFLYNDMDPKSESYAGMKSAYTAVFGEDDLQWMLVEDSLPPQVTRIFKNSNGEDDERILKLTYTPLWTKENLLQSIMIVAEDVTEIEKLRAESLKKQGEMGILQGLIAMERADVEKFLQEGQVLTVESRDLISKMHEGPDPRLVLFRNLHTLKGNSRMYGLNLLSEVVHVAENAVVEINNFLNEGREFPEESRTQLLVEMDKVEEVLLKHSQTAETVFGIKDQFFAQKEEGLHNSISDLEVSLSESEIFGDTKRDINELIKTPLELSRYFNSEPLQEGINAFSSSLSNYEKAKEAFKNLAFGYRTVCVEKKLIHPYSTDPLTWLSIFHELISFTKIFEKAVNSEFDSKIIEGLRKSNHIIISLSDTYRFLFLKTQAYKTDHFLNLKMEEFKKHEDKIKLMIQKSLKSLWNYMGVVISLDSMHSLNPEFAVKAREQVSHFIAENKHSDLIQFFEGKRILFISLMRSLLRKDIELSDFFNMAQRYSGLESLNQLSDFFLGVSQFESNLFSLILELKGNEENHQILSDGEFKTGLFALDHLMEQMQESAQLSIDLLQLLAIFRVDVEDKDSGMQMVEIPLTSFINLKTLILDMAAQKENVNASYVDTLHQSILSALDFPVKYMCRKLAPTVTELSERMGKEVEFLVLGEDVTLPREKLYMLRDILVHLVRNSMDHGIEPCDEREQTGKPRRASLEIISTAYDEGVEILVRDDGRGINTAKVVEKAIKSGAISEAEAEKMSEKDKVELIFMPNLSTKDEVSMVSGRGVGMDAVKAFVEELGGTLELHSDFGRGMTVRIRIVLKKAQRLQEAV